MLVDFSATSSSAFIRSRTDPTCFRWSLEHNLGHSSHTEQAIETMQNLLSRKSWERVWMLQELALSQQFYVMCGEVLMHGPQLTPFS